MNVREEAVKFARQLLVAVATSAVIIGGLLLAFQGQSNEERELTRVLVELQEQTLAASLAQACVLALPVDDSGRDEEQVARCFRQYGIDAPRVSEP